MCVTRLGLVSFTTEASSVRINPWFLFPNCQCSPRSQLVVGSFQHALLSVTDLQAPGKVLLLFETLSRWHAQKARTASEISIATSVLEQSALSLPLGIHPHPLLTCIPPFRRNFHGPGRASRHVPIVGKPNQTRYTWCVIEPCDDHSTPLSTKYVYLFW